LNYYRSKAGINGDLELIIDDGDEKNKTI